MREKLRHLPTDIPGVLRVLKDGSWDFGQGVIGPSLKDRQSSNFEPEKAIFSTIKVEEIIVDKIKKPSRVVTVFADVLSPAKPVLKYAVPFLITVPFVASACGDNSGETKDPNVNKTPSSTPSTAPTTPKSPETIQSYPIIFPIEGPLYLTNGPHAWNNDPNGIKNSLDFAPKSDGQNAIATVSGTIVARDDKSKPNDPNHSIVTIKDETTGKLFEHMHLQVTTTKQVGDKVSQGEVLGKPSSESPPGGSATGKIVHLSIYYPDRTPFFIGGYSFSGWTLKGNQLIKSGEEPRTADASHRDSGPSRNDLTQRAVLGTSTGPGENNGSKTPLTEPLEPGWKTIKSASLPFQINYPSSFAALDTQFMEKSGDGTTLLYVEAENIGKWVTLEDYEKQTVEILKNSGVEVKQLKEVSGQSIDGQKAWKIEATLSTVDLFGKKFSTHVVNYVFVYKGEGWLVHYESNLADFSKKAPDFEKMVKSIKLLQ